MRRTEALQGVRMIKFLDILDRYEAAELNQMEAAELLGVSERTFRRWCRRYEEDGEAGLLDRRLGKASGRRVPVDRADGGGSGFIGRATTASRPSTSTSIWCRIIVSAGATPGRRPFLQSKGLLEKAPRRGAHRRKRPRRPLPGMMLHQDGSRHRWLAGQPMLDLIVTMDDATSAIYSAFLVEEEGTASTFRALMEVFGRHGLPLSLYTDRGTHYFHTPTAGGAVDRAAPTQVGRALAHLGVEHIAAYSPQARGRSERVFQTLQDRLAKELALAGITTVEAANAFLRDVYLPAHNARFAIKPSRTVGLRRDPRRRSRRDSLRPGGASGRQRQLRVVQPLKLQIPESPLRAALRQGAGQGPSIPRRHPRHLPRAALPRPLRSRGADRGHTDCRLNPLGGEPVDGMDKSTTCPPRPQENKSRRSGHLMCYQNRPT